MKKILIAHTSRSRPLEAVRLYHHIIGESSGQTAITYALSLDKDDPEMDRYLMVFCSTPVKILVHDNSGSTQACNRVYEAGFVLDHDITICAMEDCFLDINWDTSIVGLFDKVGYDKVLKTRNQWHGDPDLLILPIGGRQFYQDYGTLYWPEYMSMYSDNDLTEWAKKNNRYIRAEHLVFPHMQYQVAYAIPTDILDRYIAKIGPIIRPDSTYLKQNKSASWEVGRAVYNLRVSEAFNNPISKKRMSLSR